MSVVLRPTTMKIRNNGEAFQGFNTVADEKTSEKIAAIEAKGAQTLASIPDEYTEINEKITSVKNDLDYNNIPTNIFSFNSSFNTTTTNGVTITRLSHNSIKLSGTATAAFNVNCSFHGYVFPKQNLFHMMTCDDGTVEGNIELHLGYFNGQSVATGAIAHITSFNVLQQVVFPQDAYDSRHYFSIKNGSIFNNTIIKFVAVENYPVYSEINTLNADVNRLLSEVQGISLQHTEEFSSSGTRYWYFKNYIPRGTTIKITNNGSGTISINLFKSDYSYESVFSSLSAGSSGITTLTFDAYGIRSYDSGTSWSLDIEFGEKLLDLAALKPLIGKENLFLCKNLVGEEVGKLYPIGPVNPGESVTISTSDGEAVTDSSINISFYYADKTLSSTGSWNFNPSTSKRTITNNESVPWKYASWSKILTDPTRHLQLEFGVNNTEYQEYFPNVVFLDDDEVDSITLRNRTFNASYHEGASDFEEKCSEFSSLLYGDVINDIDAPSDFETFLFFTDPHTIEGSNYEQTNIELITQIQKYYNSTPTTFCLCGGDWLGNSDLPADACYKMGYIDGFMHSMFKDCYLLVGNHDTNYQGKRDSSSQTYSTRLSIQSIENLWYRKEKKCYFKFSGANSVWYCFDTQSEGTSLTDYNNYGWEQCLWFAENLLEETAEHIVIAAHILYPSSIDGSVHAITNEVLLIAQAYNARTSISVNGETFDFSEVTGKVSFMISGHLHSDATATVNSIPCIMTTWVKDSSSTTATFDLMVADFAAKELKTIRVGTGNDRELTIL